MEIQNSTNDDAMIKVGGGPSGIPRKDKPPKPAKPAQWPVKKGKLISPKLPSPPYTLLFLVGDKEVGRYKVEVKSAVKKLTLTKEGTNGYKVVPN